jgi:hypothetical protein
LDAVITFTVTLDAIITQELANDTEVGRSEIAVLQFLGESFGEHAMQISKIIRGCFAHDLPRDIPKGSDAARYHDPEEAFSTGSEP